MRTLKQEFDSVVKSYVVAFCRKHDLDVEDCSWIDHNKVLQIADYCFDLFDIIYDIDKKLPEPMIIEWHNATLDHAMYPEHININLRSWKMGLRYKAPLTRLERLKDRFQGVKNTIHWYLVGKRQMKKLFDEQLKGIL